MIRDEFEKAFESHHFEAVDMRAAALWAAKWALEKAMKKAEEKKYNVATHIRQLAKELSCENPK